MFKKKIIKVETPPLWLLKEALEKEEFKHKYNTTIKRVFFSLFIVAAISILITTLWIPVLQVYGNSMSPTLKEGDVLITIKNLEYEQGDLVAFYYGNKMLVKRFIAGPGEIVNIDKKGNVYVNNKKIKENYIKYKNEGVTDVKFPYQVPEERYFVLGDNRRISVDSRNTIMGCPSNEQLVGKVMLRVWPIEKLKVFQ